MSSSRSHNSLVSIFLLLIVLLAAAFYDIVFLNKTLKVTTANAQVIPTGAYGQANNKPRFIPANGTDAPVTEEPLYEFIKNNLRRGIIPLWNPHQACGFPLIGMLETGIFFPLTWIIYLLPNIYAWDLLILSRLLLAGLFTFWFMRRIGFKDPPALCAGIVFMLSGPMVLLQYWTANVDLLTPLLLIALDYLIIREGSLRSIAYLAIAVGLTLFAGHPEHVFLVNAFGLAFFLFRVIGSQPKSSYKKLFLGYTGAYFLGIGLAAVVLFPFLRNLSGEFWSGHPAGTGLLMEEQRDRALSLALPHFFQKENLKYDFTFAGWWGGYLGTLPLALAFLSFFDKHKKGLNYFFGILLFLIVSKEYGLPYINWIGYLPVFDTCRYAIHTPPLAAFSVAILSGIGFQNIIDSKKLFSKGLIFTLALLSIAALHLVLLRNSEHFNIALEAAQFAAILLALFQLILWLKDRAILKGHLLNLVLITLIFSELFLYIHREHPRRFDSFPKVPYIEFLKSQKEPSRSYGILWAFYPDTASGFGVDDLGYFMGLVPSRYVDFVNALIIDDHFKKDLRPPALRAMPIEPKRHAILDLLNVRYIIAPTDQRLESIVGTYAKLGKPMKPVYNGEVTIFERPGALPRAYIVHRVIFASDKNKTLEFIKRLSLSPHEGIVITHTPDRNISSTVNSTPIHDVSGVKITSSTPNEVILMAEMEHPGLVVLSDAYHPDWKVFIDGKESEVFQTNFLVRSVLVPEGSHEIRFVFAPASFYIGLAVSLLSLFCLIGLFVFNKRN